MDMVETTPGSGVLYHVSGRIHESYTNILVRELCNSAMNP